MKNVLINEETMIFIGDAIREKTGKSDKILPKNMPDEIKSIKSGGATEPYIEETYDENGNLIDAKLVGYTSIRNSVFRNCIKLALTSLPEGITSISSYAFHNCTKLTELTFEGTPALIHQTAFSGCTNLTVINVPWSEGAVANAPWGAVNATINYDYTGD